MKKSRFTDSQIIEAIKRAEAGTAVPDLCRELGVSQTCYRYVGKANDKSTYMSLLGLDDARINGRCTWWIVSPIDKSSPRCRATIIQS